MTKKKRMTIRESELVDESYRVGWDEGYESALRPISYYDNNPQWPKMTTESEIEALVPCLIDWCVGRTLPCRCRDGVKAALTAAREQGRDEGYRQARRECCDDTMANARREALEEGFKKGLEAAAREVIETCNGLTPRALMEKDYEIG